MRRKDKEPMKKYLNGLKELSTFAVVAAALISGLISWSVLHAPLQRWAESHIPPAYLTVEVLDEVNPDAIPNHEVWINSLAINGNEDMRALFSDSEQEGFEYRAASEYGYSNDVITCVDGAGSYISFPIRKSEETDYIEFWKQNLSGMIRVTLVQSDNVLDETTVDLFADEAEQYFDYNLALQSRASDGNKIVSYGIIVLVAVALFSSFAALLVYMINKSAANAGTSGTTEKYGGRKATTVTETNETEDASIKTSTCNEPTKKNRSQLRFFKMKPTACICCGFIAVLLTGACYEPVNHLTRLIVWTVQPETTVTITVEDNGTPGSTVWLMDNGDEYEAFRLACAGEMCGEWEYRDKEAWDYNNDSLLSYAKETDGDNVGDTLSFLMPRDMDLHLTFWGHPGCGGVTVSSQGFQIYLDLNDPDGGVHRVHPVANNMFQIAVQVLLDVLLCILLFAAILLGVMFLMTRRISTFWGARLSKGTFLRGTAVLYIYSLVRYYIGIPNFLAFGDQMYYWSQLNPDGEWDPLVIAQRLVSFRGYLCNFFPTIAMRTGKLLGIDPVPIYFIFTSLCAAWLFFVVLPGLYEHLTDKPATRYQAILFAAVYLFFWNGTITAVLVDMFGAVCFLSGILAGLRFFKDWKWLHAAQMGFWWACACDFRLAYQYGIIVFLIAFGIYCTVRDRGARHWKKAMLGFAAAILCALPVLMPQYQINAARGHFGFLPYDYSGAWDGDRTLALISIDQSLCGGYSGYPIVVSDEQMFTVKEQRYDLDDELDSMAEVFNVYLEKPLDSLTYLIKKCFVAFDTLTNEPYWVWFPWNSTPGLLFSMVNYVVLFSGLYYCIFAKTGKEERLLATVFALGLVLPQLVTHVEWRYYLSAYILLYYFFAYRMAECLIVQENSAKINAERYFPALTTALIVSLILHLSIMA